MKFSSHPLQVFKFKIPLKFICCSHLGGQIQQVINKSMHNSYCSILYPNKNKFSKLLRTDWIKIKMHYQYASEICFSCQHFFPNHSEITILSSHKYQIIYFKTSQQQTTNSRKDVLHRKSIFPVKSKVIIKMKGIRH